MMKRFFFFGAAVIALIGCASATSGDSEESDNTEQAASGNACHWKCGHCPKNLMCAVACTQSGNCGTTCVQTMLCIQGYVFDQKSCQCVPEKGGGQPCGNGVCGANEFCCNSSCGICAPTGGACTQEICASPL